MGFVVWLVRLSCLGLCWFASAAVFAEEPADPKREAEYQQLINYALEEYERGSWEESAALFRRAHELVPSARTLRGLGLTTYEARRYAESIRYLRGALTDARRPLTDKQREEVQATLDRARLFVGYLVVDLTPETAQLAINGRTPEPEPDGSFMVEGGWIDIEATAAEHAPQSKRVRIGGGERQRIVLHLAPNSRVAEVVAPESSTRSVAAPATGATGLRPTDSEAPSRPLQTWKWVAAGAAVVALGAGGTLLAMQKIQAPAYERDCTGTTEATQAADCEQRHTLLSSTLWNGSLIGFSLGGALTALTVTLFVLDASDSTPNNGLACGGMGELGVSCQLQF
jgi:hypothetical protein